MAWGIVPEVFYDLIARLVPGSLFLIGAGAVLRGPAAFAASLAAGLPAANLASIMLLALLAYLAAIVLKEGWEVAARSGRLPAERRGPSADLLRVRSRMPAEGSWLLKLQAEKSICEVLVPGLAILFMGNLWLVATQGPGDAAERIALAVVLLVSGAALLRWARRLEILFGQGLEHLQRLAEESRPGRPDASTP
jgi:hypothetical protein